MIFNKKNIVGYVSTHRLIVSKSRRGLPDGPGSLSQELALAFLMVISTVYLAFSSFIILVRQCIVSHVTCVI